MMPWWQELPLAVFVFLAALGAGLFLNALVNLVFVKMLGG